MRCRRSAQGASQVSPGAFPQARPAVLPVFPFLNIAVLFWDGDEEFDPQANMLFDSKITQFMHEEDVVCVAADVVKYLSEAAGLKEKRIFG